MMEDAIRKFPEQFGHAPQVVGNLPRSYKRVIVAGMGGSHLAADLLSLFNLTIPLIVHSDYGLPTLSEADLKESFLIASSYSGNTEETLDALELAHEKNIPAAAIAVGGELLERAKYYGIPYVEFPDTGIQPRSALGFSLCAFLKILGEEKILGELAALAPRLPVDALEAKGKKLAERLRGKVPIVYSSTRNKPVAYNWKIKFNETGKIPAFYNVLPELNHNEMTGFDTNELTRPLSSDFYFIFLEDAEDYPRIQKRMSVLADLLERRGFLLATLPLEGVSLFERVFGSLLLADWGAYYTAKGYGAEAEKVPMVEEFKTAIA